MEKHDSVKNAENIYYSPDTVWDCDTLGVEVSINRRKRCICGHSEVFPICDGRHRSEGWTCLQAQELKIPLCFGASPHLQNFAIRLAHRFQGALLDDIDVPQRVRKLIFITDGTDIAYLQAELATLSVQETLVIGIGLHADLLRWAFPECRIKVIEDSSITALWSSMEAAVEASSDEVFQLSPPPNVFLSHAVSDEALIFPALNVLRRHYGVPLFLCADSITAGSNWRQEIESNLMRCDLYLFLSSQSSALSTYCAFEAGLASGLSKPIFAINLDGSSIPGHLSDVQAIDVPRLLQRKPWLRAEDGVLEGCLAVLQQFRTEDSST